MKTKTTLTPSTTSARIAAAKSELSRLDGLLDEVSNLKATVEAAGDSFASGKISLTEASTLVSCSAIEARTDLANRLRSPVKRAQAAVLSSLQDIVDSVRRDKLVDIRAQLDRAEGAERALADEVGLGYHRGPVVNALADQVARLEALVGTPATRSELADL